MSEQRIITARTDGAPLLLGRAKQFLRVNFHDDDLTITDMIRTAIEYVESSTSLVLFKNTEQILLPCWETVELGAPLLSVSSVTYYDTDNVQKTASDGTEFTTWRYGYRAKIVPADNPPPLYDRADAVTITYDRGFSATGATIPARAIHAVLVLVGYWYENRSAVVMGTISKEAEFAVRALCMSLNPGAFVQ